MSCFRLRVPTTSRRLPGLGAGLRASSLGVAALLLAIGCTAPPEDAWRFPDQCVPAEPPDALCYVEQRRPGSAEVSLARALADRYRQEHPPESLAWDWGPGVLLLAFTELHQVTGDPALMDYVRAYLDAHLAAGYPMTWPDHCPPAVAALAVYEDTGDAVYLAPAEEAVGLVLHEALRTEEGGISHLGTVDLFGPTLWLDSLFMFGELLLRWSEVTGDRRPLDEMGAQIRIFADRLQTEGGLFLHAYGWPAAPEPDVLWARGNGWVTASVADYLRARTLRREGDEAVRAVFARQVAAVLETQDATGLWWTVLDHPGEIYLETSASALFGYGLARGYRYGAVGLEVLPAVALALDGVQQRVVFDGAGRPYVTGISGPTTAGTYASYASVDLEADRDFGVGLVIRFLIEASGLSLEGG